jgi:hypothetical protein
MGGNIAEQGTNDWTAAYTSFAGSKTNTGGNLAGVT